MSATFWEVGKYISDKLLIAVLVIAAAFKGVAKLIVVVAAFKGVGKFIADKLLIPILSWQRHWRSTDNFFSKAIR